MEIMMGDTADRRLWMSLVRNHFHHRFQDSHPTPNRQSKGTLSNNWNRALIELTVVHLIRQSRYTWEKWPRNMPVVYNNDSRSPKHETATCSLRHGNLCRNMIIRWLVESKECNEWLSSSTLILSPTALKVLSPTRLVLETVVNILTSGKSFYKPQSAHTTYEEKWKCHLESDLIQNTSQADCHQWQRRFWSKDCHPRERR